MTNRLLILLAAGSIIFLACKKTNGSTNQLVGGKWAIRYMHAKMVDNQNIYVDSGDYRNDSFAVAFDRSGNYTLTYPSGINFTPTSAFTVWGTEYGTYTTQSNQLLLTVSHTSVLWTLFYGNGDTVVSPLSLQTMGSDSLLIVTGWGTPGVAPFYYDSTILKRVH
jgi:hypothetical protein